MLAASKRFLLLSVSKLKPKSPRFPDEFPRFPDEFSNRKGKISTRRQTKTSLLLTAQTHAEGSVDPSSSVLELSGQGVQAAGPLFGL